MASLAFPLRLRHGQLEKSEERAAFEALLAVMARTPRGSWAGDALFGFHDFFTGPAIRRDLPEPTIEEINTVLKSLGLGRYVVTSITHELKETERPRESSSSKANEREADNRHGRGAQKASTGISSNRETFVVVFERNGISERTVVHL